MKAPPAKPKHRVTYSSSCNRASVVFQTSPPKLVSEVVLHNTGSAVTYVRAETRWLYFGGGSTNEVVTPIRLGAGETKRVGISKIVDLATIEKMIGWKYGDKMCRTTVAMWNH